MLNIERLKQIVRASGDHKIILIDENDGYVFMTIQEYERLIGINPKETTQHSHQPGNKAVVDNNQPQLQGLYNNDLFESISVKYQRNPEAVNKDVTEWLEQYAKHNPRDTMDVIDDLDNDIRYEQVPNRQYND